MIWTFQKKKSQSFIFRQNAITALQLIHFNVGLLKYEALPQFFQKVHVCSSFVSEAVWFPVFLILVGLFGDSSFESSSNSLSDSSSESSSDFSSDSSSRESPRNFSSDSSLDSSSDSSWSRAPRWTHLGSALWSQRVAFDLLFSWCEALSLKFTRPYYVDFSVNFKTGKVWKHFLILQMIQYYLHKSIQ